MNKNTYITLTAVIFTVIALTHLVRIVTGFDAQMAGMTVPMWASWLGVLIAGFLAVSGFRARGR